MSESDELAYQIQQADYAQTFKRIAKTAQQVVEQTKENLEGT